MLGCELKDNIFAMMIVSAITLLGIFFLFLIIDDRKALRKSMKEDSISILHYKAIQLVDRSNAQIEVLNNSEDIMWIGRKLSYPIVEYRIYNNYQVVEDIVGLAKSNYHIKKVKIKVKKEFVSILIY